MIRKTIKKNSGKMLQNKPQKHILLARKSGNKLTMSVRLNLKVATTEEYLKKMGIDVNNQDGLSCLKD